MAVPGDIPVPASVCIQLPHELAWDQTETSAMTHLKILEANYICFLSGAIPDEYVCLRTRHLVIIRPIFMY
jgi:hypothetical protein